MMRRDDRSSPEARRRVDLVTSDGGGVSARGEPATFMLIVGRRA